MLADLVLILATILLVGLVAGWEIFCLTDLARAERVRFLPRWAWAVACLTQIPLGASSTCSSAGSGSGTWPAEQATPGLPYPNYDVHDVLACVGMEDAVAVLASARSDPDDLASAGTSVNGRVDRIYLTRDLVGAAAGYMQQDMRASEHQALMLTLDGATAARATPPGPEK
jgi:hypothetical protein